MNINELYRNLGLEILHKGVDKESRNGKTRSLFGTTIKYDMGKHGFPLLSMRKINYRAAIGEFKSFLEDCKSEKEFTNNECPYWKLWAEKNGSLKLDYSPRKQLDYVINLLKTDPNSRRIIIDLWNPENRGKLSLDPCHTQYQFNVIGKKLNTIWTQRSVDYAIGAPYDFLLAGCYVLLLCKEANLEPGVITFNFGDTHLYKEHIERFKTLMKRDTRSLCIEAVCLDKKADFKISSISFDEDCYLYQESINFLLKE